MKEDPFLLEQMGLKLFSVSRNVMGSIVPARHRSMHKGAAPEPAPGGIVSDAAGTCL